MKSLIRCEAVARVYGHGWAREGIGTLASRLHAEHGVPLFADVLNALYEKAFWADKSESNRDLYRGALGPGIGAPEIRCEHPNHQEFGGRTGTGRVAWTFVNNGGEITVSRPTAGQEGAGGEGVVVLRASLYWDYEVPALATPSTDIWAVRPALAAERHVYALEEALAPLVGGQDAAHMLLADLYALVAVPATAAA